VTKKVMTTVVTKALDTTPQAAPRRTLSVALGGRSYPIHIGAGLLDGIGALLPGMGSGRAVIVTNPVVAAHHLDPLQKGLERAGMRYDVILVPDGEVHKDWATLYAIHTRLLELKAERSTQLIALGGGVIGDLAGFAAAVVRRGLDYVQVPTSLLAQVDSSVGGKTAIDSHHGKNLVGAFHQPVLVVADTALLDTLSEREFRSGYAEVAKYGLIRDPAFFAWLESNWREVFSGSVAAGTGAAPREYAIWKSIQMKAEIVARDERETGERALLNLGHTFGHAFEAAAGFSDRLLHGEAISLGMVCAFGFSARLKLTSAAVAKQATRHLEAVGLPTRLSQVEGGLPDVDTLMDLIAQDKKVKRGKLTFILARGIGEAFIAPDIDATEVRAFLVEKIAERC
jgi:3-dehydroquinate synthase